MPLVDDRGRLMGRINLIDAAVLGLIVVLIPVAYGAYLLFRTPPARLLEVAPTTMTAGPGSRLVIWGRNLRPFMRVSLNQIQAKDFLISTPNGAEANLPPIPAGTYDVVLFDYAQEVSRLKNAITVVPLSPVPTLSVEVAGAFVAIGDGAMAHLTPGQRLPDTGDAVAEILRVGQPRPANLRIQAGATTLGVPMPGQVELPATLRVRCYAESNPDSSIRCMVQGPERPVTIMPDAQLTMRAFGTWFNFQITEVHLDAHPTLADLRVRFAVPPAVAGMMKVGDVDSRGLGYAPDSRARITGIIGSRAAPPAMAPFVALADDGRFVDVTMRVPVERTANGWMYAGASVKAGGTIRFETSGYVAAGSVVDVTVREPPK